MRSTADWRLLVVLVAAITVTPIEARQDAPATGVPSDEEIAKALAALSADPNLGRERMMPTLKWRETEQQKPPDFSWLAWIAGMLGWMGQSARYLMWAALVVLAAWLGVYLTRAMRGRDAATAADAFVPPTHVRDLDIRPESLPPNIGRAARQLWDRGEHRAALSLLYRGLLSRLTHVHRVPITDASTEGDCLLLLPGRVPARTDAYSTRLVGAWREFVYGGAAAPVETIHALCDEFGDAMDRRGARPAAGGAE